MARIFWLVYLLWIGVLLTVLAGCGGGGSSDEAAANGAAQAGPLAGAWFGADGSILFPNKCTYSVWVKT